MTNASKPINNFGAAMRRVRKAKGLSQEDFGVTSSRTYVSTLERGLKSPTLSKVDTLAEVMNVHPLTLMVLCYADNQDEKALSQLLARIDLEVSSIR